MLNRVAIPIIRVVWRHIYLAEQQYAELKIRVLLRKTELFEKQLLVSVTNALKNLDGIKRSSLDFRTEFSAQDGEFWNHFPLPWYNTFLFVTYIYLGNLSTQCGARTRMTEVSRVPCSTN